MFKKLTSFKIAQTKMIKSRKTNKISSDKKWIFGILLAFSLVVIVDIFYIIAANKTWRGLVIENSYQVGINYNQVLEQKKWQESLQIKIKSRYRREDNSFTLQILDSNQKPVTGAKITAIFRRILNQKLDFTKELKALTEFSASKSSGTYGTAISFPAYGKWWAEYQITLPQSFLDSSKPNSTNRNQHNSLPIYLFSEEIFIRP